MQGLPTIPTPRTTLAVLGPGDGALLLAWRLRNRQFLAPWEAKRGDAFYTEAGARADIARALADTRAGNALHLAAVGRDCGEMLATCAFTNFVRDPVACCQLGYAVDQAHEGTGLMAEVLRAAIGHAFGPLGMQRIMASHMPGNLRSAALLGRLGFECTGLARASLCVDGRWEDLVIHRLARPGASSHMDP
jgi:ribosomal-protein-alanine N-acetyltransferase